MPSNWSIDQTATLYSMAIIMNKCDRGRSIYGLFYFCAFFTQYIMRKRHISITKSN